MFYTLYNTDYIQNVYFGCTNAEETAIEYVGDMPAGYTSFEDWAEQENINAWRVVEGDLVYDASKDEELQEQYNADHEDNRHITNKELQDTLANTSLTDEEISLVVSNSNALAQMLPLVTKYMSGSIVQFNNASGDLVKALELTTSSNITDSVKLVFNNRNIFKNTATPKVSNGITYNVNTDKTIKINGTATANSELTIAGTATNTVPIFVFIPNRTYHLESLPTGVTVNLYSYDGTDLTLVYSGAGGTNLSYNALQNITYATLNVAANTTINNAVASLMLSVGNSSVDYMKYREQSILIPLGANTFESGDTLKIDMYGNVTLVKSNSTIQLETVTMPNTYADYNTVYSTKVLNTIRITYKKATYSYETATGTSILFLYNTPDGVGSIHKITWAGMAAGRTHSIRVYSSGITPTISKYYTLNLTAYSGTVDVSIVDGEVQVFQNGTLLGTLAEPIYLETYSPQTRIYLTDIDYPMTCEFMPASDFSMFCTRTEKDASIKVVEDAISLIVSQGGDVTPASIIAAINENQSSIKINADNIDLAGTVFPTIRNTANTCVISADAQYAAGAAISYVAPWHNVYGAMTFAQAPNETEVVITVDQNGKVYISGGNFETTGNLQVGGNLSNDGTVKLGTYNGGVAFGVDGAGDVSMAGNANIDGNANVVGNLSNDGIVRLGTHGVAYALTINSSGNITIEGNVRIKGDLTVDGTINN
jgi:hypothetical protein